ncbi:putative cytochrome P450 [Lyophyllum shimeji]|uniref:Cytochrome P450 n=1 Tax=Lyophyllum shimeji TaxID=47721 RepID=A0A9P3PSH1_LYOSH|nr:putative cytochrome P450 [Lyophyllum shimeji]
MYFKVPHKLEQTIRLKIHDGAREIDMLHWILMSLFEVLDPSRRIRQMSTLIFTATDTTSTALARILYTLSIHPEAQDRLREEVVTASHKTEGDIPYEELVVLPFMDAVCRETLRLYPPVSTVTRSTRQDVVLPLSEPVKGLDGRELQSLVLSNKTNDAAEWKPERWLSPLPQAVQDAHIPGIYSNLMTFLGGGRACTGFKFSQLEMSTYFESISAEAVSLTDFGA